MPLGLRRSMVMSLRLVRMRVACTDPVSARASHCRCAGVEALVVDALVEHVGHFGRVTYQ